LCDSYTGNRDQPLTISIRPAGAKAVPPSEIDLTRWRDFPEDSSMKSTTRSLVTTLTLICFGFLPRLQAVSPPPDGGYSGGNTAEGQSALLSLTSGNYNTAIGFLSLLSTTTNSFNTGVGAGALLSNVAGSFDNPNGIPPGSENTGTGAGALLSNITGAQNTANGSFALFTSTESNFSTAIGARALFLNTTGTENTAIGASALGNNATGNFNSANGGFALFFNDTGSSNVAVGDSALFSNIAGNDNVAIGAAALLNTTGSDNIAIGFNAGSSVGSSGNVIAIGSPGDDIDSSCFIGNIRGVQTQNADAIAVVIDSAGQLGTMSSSAKFKNEIKPMENASEAVLALKPVTFHYKGDKTGTPQFGLIAEEVAAVDPNLVVRNKNGEIYTVRYEAVNAMLLNEFLKEHRKNEEQEATIARLQKQVEALTAGLQKVSAEVEVSKPAPQTVLNQ
jgi:endosialidase-like protein